jgi:hypothetical protein
MRLTGLGKFVILIVALGIAVGGWRLWQSQSTQGARPGGGFRVPKVNMPNLGGKNGGSNGGADVGESRENTNENNAGVVEIPFVITAAKKDWVGEQVDRFNAANQGKWQLSPSPSHRAKRCTAFWRQHQTRTVEPRQSGVARATRRSLFSAEQQNHFGSERPQRLSRLSALPRWCFSPRVAKRRFLRPLLGGNDPWGALKQLSTGQRKTPWGGFRFSHADPLRSSSGVMTMGLVLFDYAQKTGQTDTLAQVAVSKRFISHMRELDRSLVYDKPAREGTTKLTNAFSGRPDTLRRDYSL